jgi:hypothetical protein
MKTVEEMNRSMIVARLRKIADAIEAGAPLASNVGVEAMSYNHDSGYLEHATYEMAERCATEGLSCHVQEDAAHCVAGVFVAITRGCITDVTTAEMRAERPEIEEWSEEMVPF